MWRVTWVIKFIPKEKKAPVAILIHEFFGMGGSVSGKALPPCLS
jgi:hypothetical protein